MASLVHGCMKSKQCTAEGMSQPRYAGQWSKKNALLQQARRWLGNKWVEWEVFWCSNHRPNLFTKPKRRGCGNTSYWAWRPGVDGNKAHIYLPHLSRFKQLGVSSTQHFRHHKDAPYYNDQVFRRSSTARGAQGIWHGNIGAPMQAKAGSFFLQQTSFQASRYIGFCKIIPGFRREKSQHIFY